jgi:excisionase family DNA binding protein
VTGPLLTARQVADLLGVSAETILRWVRRGQLPAIRLPGGAIRIREDEIDAWLGERATPQTRGVVTHPAGTPPTAERCTPSATPLRSVLSRTPDDEEG